MTTLSKLPDLCLLTIFKYLPLCHLLRIGRVSHRWSNLQLVAGRSRRKLVLHYRIQDKHLLPADCRLLVNRFVFPAYLEDAQQNQHLHELIVNQKTFTVALIRKLAQFLPRIRSLTITLDGATDHQASLSILLLSSWSTTLTSLQMFSHLDESTANQAHFLWAFFEAVKSSSSLKTLKYENSNTIQNPKEWKDIKEWDTSICTQLQHISFTSLMVRKVINSIVENLSVNPCIKSFSLGNALTSDYASLFIRPTIAPSIITHLGFVFPDDVSMGPIFKYFAPTLTSLMAYLDAPDKFLTLLGYLTTFRSLRHLTINFSFPKALPKIAFPKTKLPSITSLKLTLEESHSHLEYVNWPELLPEVQTIELHTTEDRCGICGFEESADHQQCTRLLLQPMMKCKKVKEIVTKRQFQQKIIWPMV